MPHTSLHLARPADKWPNLYQTQAARILHRRLACFHFIGLYYENTSVLNCTAQSTDLAELEFGLFESVC
jgi:hypothetical protein